MAAREPKSRSLYRYGPHPSQWGELWLPAASTPPVVVVLHGGFWREPWDRSLMGALCEDLARAGWAAWNVEYRRLPRGGWPATFEDVAAAVDALAGAADEHALDLRSVVAIGHSAGGHLALWAAARGRLPPGGQGAGPRVRVTHVVSQAGVADLREAERLDLGRSAVRELLGAAWEELLPLASPAELVPLGVPQLLVHGTEDGDVPAAIAERYAAAAQAAGDDVRLVVEPGGHYEHLDPGSALWAHVRAWLEELRR